MSLSKWAAEWDERAASPARCVDCPILKQGMAAYAAEQATIRRLLGTKYQAIWTAPPGSSTVEGPDEGRETLQEEGAAEETNGKDAAGVRDGVMGAGGSAGTLNVERASVANTAEYEPCPIHEIDDEGDSRTIDYDSDVE